MSSPARPETNGGNDLWFLYILECRDGSLYTGITNDIERRLRQHNDGSGARYTRSRRPVVLRYQEQCESRSAALIRECAVRLLTPKEKRALIAKHSQAAS